MAAAYAATQDGASVGPLKAFAVATASASEFTAQDNRDPSSNDLAMAQQCAEAACNGYCQRIRGRCRACGKLEGKVCHTCHAGQCKLPRIFQPCRDPFNHIAQQQYCWKCLKRSNQRGLLACPVVATGKARLPEAVFAIALAAAAVLVDAACTLLSDLTRL